MDTSEEKLKISWTSPEKEPFVKRKGWSSSHIIFGGARLAVRVQGKMPTIFFYNRSICHARW